MTLLDIEGGWRRLWLPMGSRTIVQPESLEDFTSVFEWERVWPLRCGRHTLSGKGDISYVYIKFSSGLGINSYSFTLLPCMNITREVKYESGRVGDTEAERD